VAGLVVDGAVIGCAPVRAGVVAVEVAGCHVVASFGR
jgi:hypothetical protein